MNHFYYTNKITGDVYKISHATDKSIFLVCVKNSSIELEVSEDELKKNFIESKMVLG